MFKRIVLATLLSLSTGAFAQSNVCAHTATDGTGVGRVINLTRVDYIAEGNDKRNVILVFSNRTLTLQYHTSSEAQSAILKITNYMKQCLK